MKTLEKIRTLPYLGLAVVTVHMMGAESAFAQQSTTVGDAAQTVTRQLTNIGKGLVAGCFLVGIGFAGAGLMKLKEAAAEQGRGQTKYSDGLWRIAVGAGLAALPAVVNMTSNSTGLGGVSITNASGF